MHKVPWLENAVFYNIYTQSFYDSNSDGIGDLNGIREKLDYIHDIGFNALWLTPFYESPFRDGGYDVTDFYKVAPRYGTNEDFVALCKRAHELDIKVLVDLVAGHTSLECEWFQQSCKAEKNEYSNRYIWTDNWIRHCPDGVGGYGERNGMFMKNYFYCQPALNYGFAQIDQPQWQLPMDHPDCRATKQEMLNIMDYWIGLGADGFRIDQAATLIKNDPDRKGLTAFWQEVREIFDSKYPNCALVSEWSYPSESIGAGFHMDFLIHTNLPSYTKLFRAEPGRNISFRFQGHSFFNQDGNGSLDEFLDDYWKQYELTKGKGYISIPTGNLDLPRISYRRTKEELEAAYAFILTMPGVPFVYYGDEIGMPYRADLPSKEGGYTRTGARTPMQWCRGKNAGFSDGKAEDLYLPVQEDGVNVADQLADENSLLNTTKKLIHLRRSSHALSADGEIEFLNRRYGGYPLVYRRSGNDGSYLICINPTDREQDFTYPMGDAQVVMENSSVRINPHGIHLAPVSFAIIKL